MSLVSNYGSLDMNAKTKCKLKLPAFTLIKLYWLDLIRWVNLAADSQTMSRCFAASSQNYLQ